ncbi:MAG: nucleotidyltransferase domain-containing protein [Bacteroidota bacterium]
MLKLEDIRSEGLILLEIISGSRAYGLDLPHSDTDLKGVFLLPKERFYGLDYVPQISDAQNNEVYYELGRFFDLLALNNPNLMEMLAPPAATVRYRHPLMQQISPDLFLSKRCQQTFAGYAMSQIRKAKGLNKKVLNPIPKEEKGVLDFCWVQKGASSLSVKAWLEQNNRRQELCGLVNLPHMPKVYALFYDHEAEARGEERSTQGYKGIIQKLNANEVALSSVAKGIEPDAIMVFNLEGYQAYKREYRQYWDWVEKRNEARYQETLGHAKAYDAKNMMHTFRLLNMAEEIAREGIVWVRRHDREELLKIRSGAYEYEELLEMAETKLLAIEEAYRESELPDRPDRLAIERKLVALRERFYA